jgi:hypothetical protein
MTRYVEVDPYTGIFEEGMSIFDKPQRFRVCKLTEQQGEIIPLMRYDDEQKVFIETPQSLQLKAEVI